MKKAMVIQPTGNRSSIHQLEKWEIHPEDLLGNVWPPKSLFLPKALHIIYSPMVHTVSLVPLLWPRPLQA